MRPGKLLIPRFKPIAHPRFGQQKLGVIRVYFDLLPQLANVNPQIFHMIEIFKTPNLSQDCAMRQHTVSMSSQVCQELELGGGEVQFFQIIGYDMPRQVYLQGAGLDDTSRITNRTFRMA